MKKNMKKIIPICIIIVLIWVNIATATTTDVKSKTDQYWTGHVSGDEWEGYDKVSGDAYVHSYHFMVVHG